MGYSAINLAGTPLVRLVRDDGDIRARPGRGLKDQDFRGFAGPAPRHKKLIAGR
jgi:hypothetical protein